MRRQVQVASHDVKHRELRKALAAYTQALRDLLGGL
jgi:hypothetical protein